VRSATIIPMLRRIISTIETSSLTLYSFMGAVAGIVFLRFFLESFSARTPTGFVASDAPTLVHYGLFFLAALLLHTLIVSFVTREKMLTVLKISTYALPLILIAPTIDIFMGGGTMAYLIQPLPELIADFLTFFGPLQGSGATVGIRIELAIVLAGLGTYIWLKTASVWRTALGMFLSYVVVFGMGAWPSLVAILTGGTAHVMFLANDLSQSLIARSFLHPSEVYSGFRLLEMYFSAYMAQSMFLLTLICGYFVLKSVSPRVLAAVKGNMRPLRLLHYVALAVLGFLFAHYFAPISWSVYDIITMLVALSCVVLLWVFAVTANDLGDEDIDRISNATRPLITGTMTRTEMIQVTVGAFVLVVLGGLSLGSYSLFYLLIYCAIVVVYSFPPLRLRQFPVVSHMLIGFACLCMVLYGFFLGSPARELAAFPPQAALLVVLVFTLGLNLKDLKDEVGDRAAGVVTIATLLGAHRAKYVIAALLFVAALLVPVMLQEASLWIPCIVSGAIAGVGVALGKREKFVFLVYFAFLAYLIARLVM
jgi:4-hydroxybenzoate polyprenyltransferase